MTSSFSGLVRFQDCGLSLPLSFGEFEMNRLLSLVLGIFVATIGVNGIATAIDKFVEESQVATQKVSPS
jgi:hypothetical protein